MSCEHGGAVHVGRLARIGIAGMCAEPNHQGRARMSVHHAAGSARYVGRLPLLAVLAFSFLATPLDLACETVAFLEPSSVAARRSAIGMVVDGRVLDTEGRSCSKCRVIAYNTSADDAFSEETDQAGRFVLRNLPAGTYLLTALGAQGSRIPDARIPRTSSLASPGVVREGC
jgi:hypothetical protein